MATVACQAREEFVLHHLGGVKGTLMRHYFPASTFAAPAPVAALALGMTVPAASRLLISTPRRTQRFVSGESPAAHAAVPLPTVTNRADEYLAPTPGTQEQSGVVHGPPGEEGRTIRDHRAILHSEPYASAGLGAASDVDRQVFTVRGGVSLFAESDLTSTSGWCHLIDTGAKRPWPTPSARTRDKAGPDARQ